MRKFVEGLDDPLKLIGLSDNGGYSREGRHVVDNGAFSGNSSTFYLSHIINGTLLSSY